MKANTCCFFGHRTINESEELKIKLREAVEKLIVEENVDTFLFGSKSRFDALCLEIVSEIKEKYPHIKRIYVRAEFPFIDDSFKAYLMKLYDDTYYPEKILGAGKAAYVERNYEMIDSSRFASCTTMRSILPKKEKAVHGLRLTTQKRRLVKLFAFHKVYKAF